MDGEIFLRLNSRNGLYSFRLNSKLRWCDGVFLAITPITGKCNLLNHRRFVFFLHLLILLAHGFRAQWTFWHVSCVSHIRAVVKLIFSFTLSGWLWRREIKWLIIFFYISIFTSSGGPKTSHAFISSCFGQLDIRRSYKKKTSNYWSLFQSFALYWSPHHYVNVKINI